MLKKNPALIISAVLALLFIILAFVEFGPLERVELTLYDLRMRFRAAGPETQTDIALINIDDDSITKLGRWPWPRSLLADMVDKLGEAGVDIVALDVIMSEPQIPPGLTIIEELKNEFGDRFAVDGNPSAERFYRRLEAARESLDVDRELSRAVTDADRVALPVYFQFGAFGRPEVTDLPTYIVTNGLLQAQGQALDYMYPAKKVTAPIESFSRAASGLGFINAIHDADGAVRRELLLVNFKGLAFPSYALRLAVLYENLNVDQVRIQSAAEGRQGLKLGQRFIPTNPNYDFFITFTDPRAFTSYSFVDVINDKVELGALEDKIVIIGVSATGVDIPQVTPLDNQMSSSALAANALQNLLSGGFLIRSGMMKLIELLVLAVLGLYLSLLLPRLKARAGALASLGLLIVLVGVGVFLFVGPGVWMKITYPILLVAIGYAAVTTTRYFVTEVIKDKAEGESAEVNRMLGLSFQNQGQLDMAFDKFRRVPVDEGMKDILYNLSLDYERKRMLNKAVAVLEYIKKYDPEYRDIDTKIKKLNRASETMIFGLGSGGKTADDGTFVIDEETRPTLGRYEIMKELGKGAMGIVYLGQDPQIGREMAIKTIRFTDEYEEDEAEKIKEQFFAEAKTAGLLSHPNIVTIYDAGSDHDLSYIAMEYLDGYDLKEHAVPANLLPIRTVLDLCADVAEALGYAHTKGVVHRDIKPANIMFLKNGKPKVTDFGIARAMASSKTKTGVVKGTPFYMSPEQITGKKVDGRSDIYSLGVVLYELLTGVQPFKADDLAGLIYKITQEEPAPVNQYNQKVPKAVAQIIDKALVKDRDHRYQKAEHMAEHLRLVVKKMDELAARGKSEG